MFYEKTLSVHYLIDGVLTVVPTRLLFEQSEDDLMNIHYEVLLENHRFISKASNDTEFAIKNLQKILPKNIKIASCQSCRYGNFCPYGDNDNEVFCLKDIEVYDRNDVVEIFSSNTDLEIRKRKLLDFCPYYKPISLKEYYTYNDWA